MKKQIKKDLIFLLESSKKIGNNIFKTCLVKHIENNFNPIYFKLCTLEDYEYLIFTSHWACVDSNQTQKYYIFGISNKTLEEFPEIKLRMLLTA